LPESRIPAIAPDNHRGAYLATQHLIGKGHRRLAFFGGSSDLVVYHDRLGGFIEACEALGIPAANRTIVEGETSRRGGMACLETAL
ncbi:substrate-binding domain-containing protein, partial [Mesorhizobium sp.]